MAGVKPFFLTGANAKIKVNGRTLAYCTNLSYSVKIDHAEPQVLGMYEASSVEPLSYRVSGSFSIVRYIADVANEVSGKHPEGIQNHGNGIGNWGVNNVSFANAVDGRAYENMDPKKLHTATTFDIEIFQKIGNSTITFEKTSPVLQKVAPGGGSKLPTTIVTTTQTRTQVSVAKIRNVRITQADFNLSKKAAATQTFNFTAIYADEDSFLADTSGLGQHLA